MIRGIDGSLRFISWKKVGALHKAGLVLWNIPVEIEIIQKIPGNNLGKCSLAYLARSNKEYHAFFLWD